MPFDPSDEPGLAQLRLFESVLSLLKIAAGQRGMLLVIEDLHDQRWHDRPAQHGRGHPQPVQRDPAVTNPSSIDLARALDILMQAGLDDPAIDQRRRMDFADNRGDLREAAALSPAECKHGRIRAALAMTPLSGFGACQLS